MLVDILYILGIELFNVRKGVLSENFLFTIDEGCAKIGNRRR